MFVQFFFWGRWWCGVILLVGVGEDAFFGGDCFGTVYSYILFRNLLLKKNIWTMSAVLHAVQHKLWTHYVHFGTGLEVDCRSVVKCCVDVLSNKLIIVSLFSKQQDWAKFTRVQDVGPVFPGLRHFRRPTTWPLRLRFFLGERFLKMLKLVHLGGGFKHFSPNRLWWQLKHFLFSPRKFGKWCNSTR